MHDATRGRCAFWLMMLIVAAVACTDSEQSTDPTPGDLTAAPTTTRVASPTRLPEAEATVAPTPDAAQDDATSPTPTSAPATTATVGSNVAPSSTAQSVAESIASGAPSATSTPSPTPIPAIEFAVNSTSDAIDTHPGDGVCSDNEGNCTLRAAILEANAYAGAVAIVLPSGNYTISINGLEEDAAKTGDLDITGTLVITGAGQASTIVDGGGIDRVFHIHQGSTAEISGLTIQNGDISDETTRSTIGGGGIKNNGDLTLSDSTITGNVGGSGGGGIANDGTLIIANTTISDNEGDSGGGIHNGVNERYASIGVLTLTNTTIRGNRSRNGAGFLNAPSGAVTLINSTVSDNGSGIHNSAEKKGAFPASGQPDLRTEPLTLINSTIADNHGNGITGIALLVNSIVSGNYSRDPNAVQGRFKDCSTAIVSLGHNLDSDGSCGLTEPSDQSAADPLLGELQDNGGATFTHALSTGSPAINGGNNDRAPSTDQRGVARPQCLAADIGAFEFEPSENCPPVATSQSTITEETVPVSVTLEGFDSDARNVLQFMISKLPENGTLFSGGFAIREVPLELPGDEVTYTPASGFTGTDRFSFRANDGQTDGNIATITVETVNATITVTKTIDTNDGTCDNDCSLREAIIAANVKNGPDRIVVPAGTYILSIARFGEDESATGDLDMTDDLDIVGAGTAATIVDGGGLDRVFHALGFGPVAISGMTIRNGDTNESGGGILSRSSLSLVEVNLSNNSATGGGGVRVDNGTLTITDSTVENNRATFGGGGIMAGRAILINVVVKNNSADGDGGGIWGATTVIDSTISGNTADSGAGIYKGGGAVEITNSTVKDNRASGEGGGIYTHFRASTKLINTTVSGNHAEDGGGIYSLGFLDSTNSTFSENTASVAGGGIHVAVEGILHGNGNAQLVNVIIAGNTAPVGPDCFGSPTSLGHNLIGDNTDCTMNVAEGDLFNVDPGLGALGNNSGTTQTYALLPGSLAIGGGDSSVASATDQRGVSRPQCGAVDIGAFERERSRNCPPVAQPQKLNTSPGTEVAIELAGNDADQDSLSFTIETLPVNGRLTQNGSPIQSSPVELRGNRVTYSPDQGFGGTDNFRFSASDGSAASANALVEITVPRTLKVTKTTDTDDGACNSDCSLREALAAANPGARLAGANGDTVSIPAGTYTLTLGTALLIDRNLKIEGAGSGQTVIQAAVDPESATSGVFRVLGVDVSISAVTIRHGIVKSTQFSSERRGGGLFNGRGDLTLRDVVITENQAQIGGGVFNLQGNVVIHDSIFTENTPGAIVSHGGTVFVSDSRFEKNTSGGGSGIWNCLICELTVIDSVFTGNTASGRQTGGAIYNGGGSVTIERTTITGNISSDGGGLYNDQFRSEEGDYTQGMMTVIDSTVSGNEGGAGGGVMNWGRLELINTDISGNTGRLGGGIFTGGIAILKDSTISRNSSSDNAGGVALWGGTITVENSVIATNTAENCGGGFYNDNGTITLIDTRVFDNTAICGAGISNGDDTLILIRSSIIGNRASRSGGGVSGGTITITDSTIANNSAVEDSGGISGSPLKITGSTITGNTSGGNGGGVSGGSVTLENSTISGNTAIGNGGGMYVSGGSTNRAFTLLNTTVTGNSAVEGGGIWNGDRGVVRIEMSIIAGNTSGGDCSGGISSLGFNLDSDGTCGLGEPTDVSNTDPQLGPLGDNGGSTETHDLMPGSPAIDSGNSFECPFTDQRGVTRPQGAACDIGAVEAG